MEITIDNKKFIFNYASFKDVYNFASFISRQTKGELELFDNIEKINISIIVRAVLSCIGDSEESYKQIFNLSKNCIFNNEKVDENFFNDVANRKYFIEIMKTIIMENIKVFMVEKKIM